MKRYDPQVDVNWGDYYALMEPDVNGDWVEHNEALMNACKEYADFWSGYTLANVNDASRFEDQHLRKNIIDAAMKQFREPQQ